MNESAKINFHDIVNLYIQSNHPFFLEYYRNEYANHLVENFKEDIPRVSLDLFYNFVPLIPRKNHRYYLHKLLAFWQYHIDIASNKIKISALSNYFGLFMIHHMLAHPSIRYLSAYQNKLLLHAGAVTRDGKSIIITGEGGAGKTTTTSLLLADEDLGCSLHADDYVFLDEAGHSLAYLTRSHLYDDLMRWVPKLSKRLTRSEVLRLRFFSLIRKLSNDTVKWPTRISYDRLWPKKDIQKKAKISSIISLSPGNRDSPKIEQVKQTKIFAEELIEMNFSEAGYFIDLASKLISKEKFNVWLNNWREKEHDLLLERLSDIPHYRLLLPLHPSFSTETRENISQILSDLLI